MLADALFLINDVVQAAIVIFGLAVVLFNLRHTFHDRVTRSFSSLLFFVVIVYFAELMVTRTTIALSSDLWVRLEWIGIAMVPAALFHLADALLVTTGEISRLRRILVRVFYLTGVAFFVLAIFSDLIVSELIILPRANHMSSGPLFPVFALYYWIITGISIYFAWRARKRCVTHTTRKRMSVIFATYWAAPLAVFPYLLFNNNPNVELSGFFWLALLVGNIIVSIMFALLTYYIAYFGATSPERVVRVRLFKYMARVPLAATLVLLVYIAVSRAGAILGLPFETALALAVVGTVILVEWAIYAFKRPMERLFQLTDEPEVRRIQQLSERVVTTRDMNQFLESVLASACEVLRTPSAFIAATTPDGPKLEATVGPLHDPASGWSMAEWQAISRSTNSQNGGKQRLKVSGRFVLWRDFWIRPLHDRSGEVFVGILGVKARATLPDLTVLEEDTFERLVEQAANALEDRILQQEVFASVEGLLPEVTALQRRRSAATFGGTPALTASPADDKTVLRDPDFNNMVRDALSHYWGGPKLTHSPLLRLQVVQRAMGGHGGNPAKALREILARAVEQQRPSGERSMTTAEWILYNILELKFIQGQRVRNVARRLAMSESDLYRKQRVAIENVAQTISMMEQELVAVQEPEQSPIVGESPA